MQATVALQDVVDPHAPQVVDYPYATHWPISPGSYAFEDRVADTRSRRVRVTVQ